MTMTAELEPAPDARWLEAELEEVRPKPRKIRGLRLKAVPSGSLVAQVLGGLATLGGVYMQWGIGVTLIIGGAAALTLGTLREAGKL